MLTNITFKAGSAPGQPPLSFNLEPSVTVFVGPNNAGKSTALHEFQNAFAGNPGKVISSIDVALVPADEVERFIDALVRPSSRVPPRDHVSLQSTSAQDHFVDRAALRQSLMHPNKQRGAWWNHYGQPRTLFLTGDSRTHLLSPQERNDLENPNTEFGRLYLDAVKRDSYRTVIAEALGLHVGVIAYMQGSQIHIRFGKVPPPNERGLPESLMPWIKQSIQIGQVSDGVRAFAGILLKLKVGEPSIIIVDEPEAFLHPALANRLGKEMALGAVSEQKFVFAATHSAHFLMGAIQSGAKVNIVRLTYRDDVATARHLDSDTVKKLMNDPLLRSVGVLDGLFFEHVVVTEADADRAFYAEINHRLLSAGDPRGIPHALFLNADNKQTVPTIVKALRQIGVPTAAIVDIDLIVDDWRVVSKQLDGCSYPAGGREGLSKMCTAVLNSLQVASSGAEPKHKRRYFKANGGVAVLNSRADSEAAANLFDEFDKYGCFAVRSGELESWLPHLEDVPRKKDGEDSFRAKIFEAMGSDPNDIGYVRPTVGDVWDFIGKVKAWLVNPNRRGIPD